MNKILRFSLLSLLAILTSSTYAKRTVTIDFDNDYQTIFPTLTGVSSSDSNAGDFTENTYSAEIDGVTIGVSAAAEGVTNPNRIWTSSPRLRMYSGILVVACTSGDIIEKIEFNASKFSVNTEQGTLTDQVWTDGGQTTFIVAFNVEKNTQIKSLTVTLRGLNEETVDWTVAGTKPLVDNAWDPAYTGADMTSTDGVNYTYKKEDITLEAGVSNEFKIVKNHSWDEAYPSSNYSFTVNETAKYDVTITFNSDSKEIGVNTEKKGEAGPVEHVYSVIGTINGNWDVDTDMTKGTDGLFTAVFTGVAKGTYKFKVRTDHDWSAAYPSSDYSLDVQEDNSTVTITFNEETKAVEASVQAVEILTVAKALEIINALENGKTTADEYIVKGFVISIKEISTQYGNATFDIADEKGASTGLTVYRVKGFDGEKITDENLLKVGDEVVVQGKLQKYVKGDVVTPEVATGGKIISINGNTSNINNVEVSKSYNGAIYNVAGQMVTSSYKGMVIKNGRKFIQK